MAKSSPCGTSKELRSALLPPLLLTIPDLQMSSNYLIIYRVAQNRSWEVTSAMFTLDWPQQDCSTAPQVPAWRIRKPSSADVTLHPSKGNVYTDEIVPSSHESGSFGSKGEQNV